MSEYSLEDEINNLVLLEKDYANQKYGELVNCYEGYGLIKIKLEELNDVIMSDSSSFPLDCFWRYIKNNKRNSIEEAIKPLKNINDKAIQIALKAIQMAAMSQKNIDYLKKFSNE